MTRISPKQSQAFGLAVSVITGLAVSTAVWGFFVWKLDFWHLHEVLGPVLGFIGGCLSAYAIYTTGMREIPLYWIGVGLFLGKPDETSYENGIQWVSPFGGIRNVPGPEKKFVIMMPGERINAQDSSLILFGISENADKHPGKRNRIQVSVVDPLLFIKVKKPADEVKEAYLQEARLFFNKVSMAIGVKSENSLFNDFITLPQESEPDAKKKHDDFEVVLRAAKFVDAGKKGKPTVPFFSKDLATVIMLTAGNFQKNLASWGLGELVVFTPAVRENPEAEAAGAARSAMKDAMVGLKTKVGTQRALAKEWSDDGVTQDLAATLVAGAAGQTVDIKNETFHIPGLKEGVSALGQGVNALGQAVERFGQSQQPKRKQSSNKQRTQPTRSQS